jgi:hypothetical protein
MSPDRSGGLSAQPKGRQVGGDMPTIRWRRPPKPRRWRHTPAKGFIPSHPGESLPQVLKGRHTSTQWDLYMSTLGLSAQPKGRQVGGDMPTIRWRKPPKPRRRRHTPAKGFIPSHPGESLPQVLKGRHTSTQWDLYMREDLRMEEVWSPPQNPDGGDIPQRREGGSGTQGMKA